MTHNETSQPIETDCKKEQKMQLVGKDLKEAILNIGCMSRTDMHAQNTQIKILRLNVSCKIYIEWD